MVERQAVNLDVAGSNPAARATKTNEGIYEHRMATDRDRAEGWNYILSVSNGGGVLRFLPEKLQPRGNTPGNAANHNGGQSIFCGGHMVPPNPLDASAACVKIEGFCTKL